MDNKIDRMEEYSALSSWAIWESIRPDGEFTKEKDLVKVKDIDFSKYEHRLQKSNTIFVAMNPGGKFDEEKSKLATRKREDTEKPWNNFHNGGSSNDHLLAQAIKDTPESGSYITDFFQLLAVVVMKLKNSLIQKITKN
ncbi:hypothetical protein V425_01120 [Lactococcus lactis RTB018]|nr:hypothetical protein [Lactococcus lactis]OAZ17659.1 hypothetical protein V425_01120 [Lactococcus lactis RTB018]